MDWRDVFVFLVQSLMASSTTSCRSAKTSSSEIPICGCGEYAVLKISRTKKNPGRKFWTCRYYPVSTLFCIWYICQLLCACLIRKFRFCQDETRCTYFFWDDKLRPASTVEGRLQRQVMSLQCDLDDQQITIKRLHGEVAERDRRIITINRKIKMLCVALFMSIIDRIWKLF